MTERRTNRLTGDSPNVVKFTPGTPEARMQLQEHCDRQNASGGPFYWFVTGSPGSLTVDKRQRDAKPFEPRCTPAEAREILRREGLEGSKICREILAKIEAADAADRKAKPERAGNRTPTREDYIRLGVDPAVLDRIAAPSEAAA